MAKTWYLIILFAALLIAGMLVQKTYTPFIITGSESMTRTAGGVSPSTPFTLTYTALGTSGTWGASIQDSVTGGCKFPDGTTSYKTVMLSTDGSTKSIQITAPASGSCTFTGDYQFGNSAVKSLSNTVVTICTPTCTRPSNLCAEAASTSNTCGGYCTGSWTVTKNTNADTDCNGQVDRTELGVIINNWIAGSATRSDLASAINAWIG